MNDNLQLLERVTEPSCGCGHDHHDHTDHHHDHAGHDAPGHIHGPDCGCGHDHGDHGHSHDTVTEAPYHKPALLIGLVLVGLSFLPPLSGLSVWLMSAGTLLVGYPLFVQGFKNLRHLQFEELSLMSIAVSAALIIGEAPEAMMVTVLFRIGEWLEARAVARSRREIEALTEIRPNTAHLVAADGSATQMPAYQVPQGSNIMILPGERIPLDCVVTGGQSFIDTSALTGEPLPRAVAPGDELLSGTVNTDGLLYARTLRSFESSAASRIIQMVEASQAQKGRTEKFISRFSRVYTPIVMSLAVALALLPPILGMGPLTDWVMRALVFLVASCPCAFVIAVPLTFFSGVGAASRKGVLVKGTRYIEALAYADAVAFDKTGTLTEGVPAVEAVIPAPGVDKAELIELAATAEQYSNHPAAKAVVAYAGTVPRPEVVSFNEITGMGVSLELSGMQLLCGSAKLMAQQGVDISHLPDAGIYVAKNGVALGAITLTDRLRPEAASAVDAIVRLGADVYMLSGDNPVTAREVGAQVGIGEVKAGLLPEDKVAAMSEIKKRHRSTLFVGDGINDAPTLALADAGVAMGLGTDTAIEAADVVLMGERLVQLPAAMALSRRVMRKARFNIAFALAVKIGVLILGALGYAAMWMAVFADVGVTVLCVLNAVTLLADRSGASAQLPATTPVYADAAD